VVETLLEETMKTFGSILASLTLLLVVSGSLSSCAAGRATGRTVSAVGDGAGQALGGVAKGTNTAITGTGRAVTKAANEVDDKY
jgi:hypothetical protein